MSTSCQQFFRVSLDDLKLLFRPPPSPCTANFPKIISTPDEQELRITRESESCAPILSDRRGLGKLSQSPSPTSGIRCVFCDLQKTKRPFRESSVPADRIHFRYRWGHFKVANTLQTQQLQANAPSSAVLAAAGSMCMRSRFSFELLWFSAVEIQQVGCPSVR